MYTLVIQSVFSNAVILLLDTHGDLVEEITWKSDKDELQKLPPEIFNLIDEKEISEIVVVVGKGNFSATRISVTIANILSLSTNAKLYELELEEEISSNKLYDQVKRRRETGWKPVKIAKPVYKTAPMITPSKKQKFNT